MLVVAMLGYFVIRQSLTGRAGLKREMRIIASHRFVDAPDVQPSFPANQWLQDALTAGYRQLGNKRVEREDGYALYLWLLAHPDTAGFLELYQGERTNSLVFLTEFPDGTVGETVSPNGGHMLIERLVMQGGKPDLAQTASQHRRLVEAMTAAHGQPLRVSDGQAAVAFLERFNAGPIQAMGGAFLRRTHWTLALQGVMLALLVLAQLPILLGSEPTRFRASIALTPVAVLLFALMPLILDRLALLRIRQRYR